jgi:hypothetical protein
MLDRLRGRPTAPDPAGELERERRLAEAGRDRDRMQDRVLETDQHYVTRGGAAGGLLAPRGEWPSDRGARR